MGEMIEELSSETDCYDCLFVSMRVKGYNRIVMMRVANKFVIQTILEDYYRIANTVSSKKERNSEGICELVKKKSAPVKSQNPY